MSMTDRCSKEEIQTISNFQNEHQRLRPFHLFGAVCLIPLADGSANHPFDHQQRRKYSQLEGSRLSLLE